MVAQSDRTSASSSMAVALRDPTAIAMVQTVLRSSGAAQVPVDAVAVGTLRTTVAGKSSDTPITVKSKGSQLLRTEMQQPTGTSISIINHGHGTLQRPNGKVMELLTNNTFVERADHIPIFSLLAEYEESGMSVENLGSTTVMGRPANIVALRPLPQPNISQAMLDQYISKTKFYIDEISNEVVKIERTNYAENDTSFGQKFEIYLSNYQSINGVLVPFRQTEFHDEKLDSDLILQSVTFNNGLSDTEFTLPEQN